MSRILLILFVLLVSLGSYGQYVDTCIIIQPGPSTDKDALIHGLATEQGLPHAITREIAMNAWTFGGTFGVVRSAIDFDINKHIPVGMPIKYARLTLYAWNRVDGMGPHEGLSGSNEAWVERIITPWNVNTMTWNNQPQSTTQNRISLPASSSGSQNYIIDVTQMVNDMRDYPNSSFGFLFKLKTEDYYRRLTFCSANYPDSSRRPKLEICTSIPIPKVGLCAALSRLSLFPNPADEELSIYIADLSQEVKISIFDTAGRRIMEETFVAERSHLSVAHLAQGVYILEIQTEDCGILHRKFMVNR